MKSKYVAFCPVLLSFGLDQGTKIWGLQQPQACGLSPRHLGSQDRHQAWLLGLPLLGKSRLRRFSYVPTKPERVTSCSASGWSAWSVWPVAVSAAGSSKWLGVGLGLLAGGAIGNMLDRAMYSRSLTSSYGRSPPRRRPMSGRPSRIADAALVIGVGTSSSTVRAIRCPQKSS